MCVCVYSMRTKNFLFLPVQWNDSFHSVSFLFLFIIRSLSVHDPFVFLSISVQSPCAFFVCFESVLYLFRVRDQLARGIL